ncbi:hypothetical protein [Xanthobacter autotrophicus]|uniref:hypothetical protein n=1 Tax=Xanthobacter autotrophicus TaxID=280 RepID=UPI0037270500
MNEAPSFSRMAAAIRAGDDEAAEREFDALVRMLVREITPPPLSFVINEDGSYSIIEGGR